MTMLAVQSLLLIMAAFFAGAMTACFLRRVLFVSDNERPNPNDGGRVKDQSTNDVVTTSTTYAKTTTVSATNTSRFARALTGQGGAAAATADVTETTQTPSSTRASEVETAPQPDVGVAVVDQDGGSHVQEPGSKVPTLSVGPLLPSLYATSSSATSSDTAKTVAATAAAVAASAATIAATASATPANDDGAIIAKSDPDDLTLIHAITPHMAQRLNADGVSTFSDIRNWHASDVAAFNKAFGYVGRIEKENWIEQAAVLSKGGTTYFSGQQSGHDMSARSDMWSLPARTLSHDSSDEKMTADEAAWARDEPAHTIPPLTIDETPTLIDRGMTSDQSHRAEGTAASGEDTLTIAETALVGSDAHTLDETASVADETPTLIEAVSTDQEGHASEQIVSTGDQAQSVENASAAHEARAMNETVPHDDVETAPSQSPGVEFERDVEHVSTYEHDLAPQQPAPSEPLSVDGAAQEPQSEPFSSRTDVSGLRSVRSEALVGQDATHTSTDGNVLPLPTATSGMPDDLKRIRGIGVLIEKKLNAMGVRSYQQIANWTAADIARISETLDFKGRIERESWIEQARILSSGGLTEFSRRSS